MKWFAPGEQLPFKVLMVEHLLYTDADHANFISTRTMCHGQYSPFNNSLE